MIKEYAKNLKKANGLEKALNIVERCINAASAARTQDIPNSDVFYTSTRKGTSFNDKNRRTNESFYLQVRAELRKGSK